MDFGNSTRPILIDHAQNHFAVTRLIWPKKAKLPHPAGGGRAICKANRDGKRRTEGSPMEETPFGRR